MSPRFTGHHEPVTMSSFPRGPTKVVVTTNGAFSSLAAYVRAEVRDAFERHLRHESEEILITRHGKPTGVLIGFETEDDWFDDRQEHHPEFLR